MTTIRAEDVRIPRLARDAVARHEHVLVISHGRPALVMVHPDDDPAGAGAMPRGRPLHEALALLAAAPAPDPDFAADMEAIRATAGSVPEDLWAQ